MRKKLLASLLAAVMLVSLLPTSALAAQEDGTDSGTVCTGTADCTAEAHSESCPLYVAPEEDDPETPADPTAVEQLQERINALPTADELAGMSKDEQAEVYEEVCAIYDAIDALTEGEAAELDMNALEEASEFFNPQIMPLEDTEGNISGGIAWTISDGTLTISAASTPQSGYSAGEMPNYTSSSSPWYNYTESITSIVVEDSVISIGSNAFRDTSAVSVTFGTGLTSIGDWAFRGTSLTDVTIPGNVKTLGSYVFQLVSTLKAITVQDGVEVLSDFCFQQATGLETLSLPSSIQAIGDAPLRGCTSLKTLTLGNESASSNNKYTVQDNMLIADGTILLAVLSSDSESLTVPDGITRLGSYLLENNTTIKSLALPASLTEIGTGTLSSCAVETISVNSGNHVFSATDSVLYGNEGSELIFYPSEKTDTNFAVPNSVTTIKSGSFNKNTHLTTVSLGENVTVIESSAFSNCSSLTAVTFNDKLQTVGDYAFQNTKLTSLALPDSVTAIGTGAFRNCTLTYLHVGSGLKTIGANAFYFKSGGSDSVLIDLTQMPSDVTLGTGAFTTGTGGGTNGMHQIYVMDDTMLTKVKSAVTGSNACYIVTNGGIVTTTSPTESVSPATVTRENAQFKNYVIKTLGTVNANHTYQHTVGGIVTAFCSGSCITEIEAVWSYSITFDANGGSLGEDTSSPITVVEGSAISSVSGGYTLPTPTKESSTFVGWNTAADGSGSVVTTSTIPTGNMTIYAIWGMSAGDTYSIYPIEEQTYTGNEITPKVYLVDKSGNKFEATGVTYENNTAVGTATAKVPVSGTVYSVSFTIVPKLVTKPTEDTTTFTYNGREQTYNVTASDDYTVSGNTMTNAGSQIVTVALKDKTNTKWADGSTNDLTFTFTIGKATYDMSSVSFDNATYTYDGTEKALTITGTLPDGVNVSYSGNTLTNVGSTTATASFTGDSTNYEAIDNMTATLTITAAGSSVSITANGATSLDKTGSCNVTLAVSGVPDGGTVTVVQTDDQGSEAKTLSLTTNGSVSVSLSNTTAKYTFTVSYAGDDNHSAQTASCTVSVTKSGGSGGGGGGSSSSSTTTETTKNSDGSTTTTVTNKTTGTVTETTKYTDGSSLVVVTEKDGTVTTTETTVDKVVVKTVDEPGEDVTATVTIPRSVGTATVTIPADTTPGTVAVDADTGEIVKLSVPTDDGMLVKLDGSADLVLVDKSKDFTDTRNHWAEDAIDFATAHGMFGGTSATTFTPDGPMTRGMIAVVLHNLEDNPDHAFEGSFDDVHPDSWYADGIHWMVDNGIGGGYGNGKFGADDKITREQLATFLYRYAGVMGYGTSGGTSLSGFTDAGSVSGYATEAMQWAVGNGLIGGMGNGTLAPQGNATRAQVATILMRFIENLTK